MPARRWTVLVCEHAAWALAGGAARYSKAAPMVDTQRQWEAIVVPLETRSNRLTAEHQTQMAIWLASVNVLISMHNVVSKGLNLKCSLMSR